MHESESKVAQSCLTFHDPMDCSLPDSSVHGIFQARVLEWGAIAFSNILHCCYCCYVASVVSDSVRPHRRQPTRLRRPWDSPGKNNGVGCHFLLQGKLPDPGIEPASFSLALCDPMNHSTPGLPVHHQLPEFTQTHVHRVSNAIQPSHPLSSPSPAPNPSQHEGLFQ